MVYLMWNGLMWEVIMNTTENISKEIIVSTIKGAAGAVPVVGSFLSSYLELSEKLIVSKRQKEWKNMVEEKLSKIDSDMSEVATKDFFYSCVQTATIGALKAYQNEKCKLFANALYNSYTISNIADEKKLIFLSLLDKYSLLAIKVLKCYSDDNYEKYNIKVQRDANPNPNNMMRTTVHHGTEKPINYLIDEIPELEKERELAKTIANQLADDGLIEPVDFNMPEHPQSTRRKRTTTIGDEFLEFIYENE
jgi:UDP-N-acetylglucosamine transferase subunit ALG13